MSAEEMKLISQTAAASGLPEKVSAFKMTSPSNKIAFIGIAALAGIAFVAIYMLSRPRTAERTTPDGRSQLMARLIPKQEVTPGYIDNLSENKFLKPQKKDEQKEAAQEAEKTSETKAQPASTASMMIYTSGALASQLGALGVPMGTELKAVLEKTVVTDDRSVPVIARITDGYSSGGVAVIPRNSRLFGSTQGMVEDRVSVRFSKIVFPDGKEHPFSGIALDADGAGGVAGNLNKKHGRRGRNIVSSALIGASGVFAPSGAGFSETAARGAHGGAAGELMRDSHYYRRTEAMPIITLRAKTPLTILVDRAV